MCSSTSMAERTAKTAFICKLAFCSIPRCGVAAIILLIMGFSMIFPGIGTARALGRETNAPYDLSVMCKEPPQFRLLDYPMVERMSPVKRVQAQLSVEDYSQSIEILGVFSNFLELDYLQGGSFQDSTYMPFLVMNEAAGKAFFKEKNEEKRTVDLDTRLTLKGLGEDQEALISGIFRDGQEKPVYYMSYDTASRNLPQSEELEYLLHLPHKGDCVKAAKLLSRQRLDAVLDQNEIQRWELMRSQTWQYLLTALAGLVCGYVMIWKQHQNDAEKEMEENMSLLAFGFTQHEVRRIFLVRGCFTTVLCLLMALSYALIASI